MMARYKSGIYPINTLYARHLVKMLGIVRDKDDYHYNQLVGQPLTVALRERKALQICP